MNNYNIDNIIKIVELKLKKLNIDVENIHIIDWINTLINDYNTRNQKITENEIIESCFKHALSWYGKLF